MHTDSDVLDTFANGQSSGLCGHKAFRQDSVNLHGIGREHGDEEGETAFQTRILISSKPIGSCFLGDNLISLRTQCKGKPVLLCYQKLSFWAVVQICKPFWEKPEYGNCAKLVAKLYSPAMNLTPISSHAI